MEKHLLKYGKEIIALEDFFSASWMMSLEKFRKIDTHRIQTVESACFVPFRQFSSHLRMTYDWLEFCVEHMSKWWKIIDIKNNEAELSCFINKLEGFTKTSLQGLHSNALQRTLVIIPFMPYENNETLNPSFSLTVSVLKATTSSILRYGAKRIIIVCRSQDRDVYEPIFPSKINQCQIVFKVVDNLTTKYIDQNMPFGAIKGLQDALINDIDDWLGFSEEWESVYLTEPDSFLHAKPNNIDSLINLVKEKDLVFSPHRLQPIPHESDIWSTISGIHPISDDFANRVIPVLSYSHFCYDGGCQRSYGSRTSGAVSINQSNTFWYMSGFRSGNHSYLNEYSFMRLSQGIGITMLMGSEHGRMCFISHS